MTNFRRATLAAHARQERDAWQVVVLTSDAVVAAGGVRAMASSSVDGVERLFPSASATANAYQPTQRAHLHTPVFY